MSAWWTKIRGVIKKHDDPRPKFSAVVTLTFARANGTPTYELGLYRKDPEKFPDAANELPTLLERAARKGRKR